MRFDTVFHERFDIVFHVLYFDLTLYFMRIQCQMKTIVFVIWHCILKAKHVIWHCILKTRYSVKSQYMPAIQWQVAKNRQQQIGSHTIGCTQHRGDWSYRVVALRHVSSLSVIKTSTLWWRMYESLLINELILLSLLNLSSRSRLQKKWPQIETMRWAWVGSVRNRAGRGRCREISGATKWRSSHHRPIAIGARWTSRRKK